MMPTLSFSEARRLALQAQGLLGKRRFGTGKKGALEAIHQLSYIQIDPISVICRAHHHTLWNRCPGYTQETLATLQAEKKVFEYWSHAAAYLPMRDYGFSQVMMKEFREKPKHWFSRDKKLMKAVLERIAAEGPLLARDFASGKKKRGVWSIGPYKQALHELFMQGDLVVVGREGIQKRFDLATRVIPNEISTQIPSRADFAAFLLRRGIIAHGFTSPVEVAYLRKGWRPEVIAAKQMLVESGEMVEIKIGDEGYLTTPAMLENIPKRVSRARAIFVSPFDNAIIQRKRLLRLFNFPYQTEIYLPAVKRVYGYFAMPILWGDQFVGRIDPKADRKTSKLLIQNIMLEPTYEGNDRLHQAIARELKSFASFNDCQDIVFAKKTPLNQALQLLL